MIPPEDSDAPSMTPNPRQTQLLTLVHDHEAISIDALADALGVTLQTIRRDVRLLEDAQLLARYHGGVRAPSSTIENQAYQQRQSTNAEGKQRIAKAVAAAIPDHCALLINLGTTNEAIARELLHHKGLRVITNNLNVATILSANTACEVIVAGGVMRPADRGIVGETAVDFIRQFRVDIGLIGISSIEADGTLRDYDLREVKVAQAIIEHSRSVWLAADHSKFNRLAMVELARIDQIDRLYTDGEPPAPFPALLQDAGVQWINVLTQPSTGVGTP
jgi:DeoR family glycerol-3-phosphate regulon repressor